jgi:transposase InsO family protein
VYIEDIHFASNKTYGYRRIKMALKNFYKVKLAYKTVRKLMKELHIICKVRKRKYRYISQITNKIVPNILNRNFKSDKPNKMWVTDVTEFRVNRKRLYLSVIQDLYNGEIKGYQISRNQNQQMILLSIKKATNPNDDLSDLLIHSDQGIIYQTPKYRNYLKKSSIRQSMSRQGNCYDNAVVESFFGSLKCETIYLQKVRTLKDLIKTIDDYIYFYNNDRIKLTLGGYSPVQYRLMNS